jgi:ABC-2 type transport system permease protein
MPWINVLSANVRKVGIERLRYLPDTISSFVTFYAIFLLLFLGVKLIGDPATSAGSTQVVIVDMVLWFLALIAMQDLGWEITTEATRGTLEQLYMSPIPTWSILLARIIGTVVINFIIIVLMLVLGMFTAGQWLTFDVLTLAPLVLLTICSMLGVGFMVAGLAVVFKQIQSLLQIAQFIFFALVAVPVTLSPWLELAPVVRGASMLREALIQGKSLGGFSEADWALLVGNAAFYLLLGILFYKLAERRAMRRGLLGQY